MDSGNAYKYIKTAGTHNLFGTEVNRVILHGIQINKTLGGTLTVKSGTTTIGIFSANTLPGSYWISTNGIVIESANIVNAVDEDVTVIYTNIG